MSAPPSAHVLPDSLSPDHLDALSTLCTVLVKVRAGIQSSADLASGTQPGGAQGPGTGATPSASGANAQQISFKDVPGATDALKHNVQHARAQLRRLPDMDRTTSQQEKEIAELHACIERQRVLLERLRDGSISLGKDDGAVAHMKEM